MSDNSYFAWLAVSAQESVKKQEADVYIEQFQKGLLTVSDLALKLLEIDDEYSI